MTSSGRWILTPIDDALIGPGGMYEGIRAPFILPVPLGDDKYAFACDLCRCDRCGNDFKAISESEMKVHIASLDHQKRLNIIKLQQKFLREELKSFDRVLAHRMKIESQKHRVAQLGLLKWREHVEELQNLSLRQILENVEERELLPPAWETAVEVLEKYELMEKISLLELAVWNARNLSEPLFTGGNNFRSIRDAYRHIQMVRKNNRILCGMDIIIKGVIPFLGYATKSNKEPQIVMSAELT